MERGPSLKPLFFLTLFVIIINSANSYVGWAYFTDEAEEYRFKADKLQKEWNLDQAIVYYQKAIGVDKYCLAAYNGLAICFEKKGMFSSAEEWYLRALEINPNYAPAHYNLGLLYERNGEIDKAVYHWKQRMRLGNPAEPEWIKSRKKVSRYAPEQLEEEDAALLSRQIVEQQNKSALDEVLGRKSYTTNEEKIQDYYLEGMQRYQDRNFQGAAEYFHKMIEALPFSE